MITDPNYVVPAHLNTVTFEEWYTKNWSNDYLLMVQRELSGSEGEEPQTVVEQVTDAIYALDHISNAYTVIY